MLNTEMLARLRSLLDETTAEIYIDSSELYPALSEAQLELCNVIAQSWYQRNQQSLVNTPRAVQGLLTNSSSTISLGSFSFALTDVLVPVLIQWNPAGAVASGKFCLFSSDGGNFRRLLENRLLSDGYYCWWDGASVLLNPVSADASAGYSFDYLKVPVDITGAVQPESNEVAHDAIVERACWILLKDRETEQANTHLQLYTGLLKGLMV